LPAPLPRRAHDPPRTLRQLCPAAARAEGGRGMRGVCCGEPMIVANRFLFGHEETDTPYETESLFLLQLMGIELGGYVTVRTCASCGNTIMDIAYPDRDEVEA